MKFLHTLLMLALVLCTLGSIPAQALEYHFTGPENNDFYRPTSYEEVYGSDYNYGGLNVVEFTDRPTLPGYPASAPVQVPLVSLGVSGYTPPVEVWDSWTGQLSSWGGFTSVDSVKRTDGSIGTLSIPKLGISRKTYPGTTAASMNKGLGHFDATSAWEGNVGFCGHNRGSSYNIGEIKNLVLGDTVTYTTALGTRSYQVTFVGKISATDWSYLGPTEDNRITLITCVENHPAQRWCVQATAD